MYVTNTHFKCLKSYYRDSRVKVTHLFLECMFHPLSHTNAENPFYVSPARKLVFTLQLGVA